MAGMNKIYAIAGGGVLGIAIALLAGHFTEHRGEATAEVKLAHVEVLAKEPIAAAAETVFVHDTVVLRKTITAYRDSRDDYNRARDTLNVKDTAQVKSTIAKADTALAHADSVAAKCDTTVKHAGGAIYTRKELDEAVARENAAIRRMVPGRLEKVTTAAKWAGVGIVLDKLAEVLIGHRK